MNELFPVYLENNIFNFNLKREVRSTGINKVNEAHHCLLKKSAVGKRRWQSCALESPTKILDRDVAPIGDDIEPVGESRADVEMGNEEDEEPLEAEIPRVRMNQKNPTSQRETRT